MKQTIYAVDIRVYEIEADLTNYGMCKNPETTVKREIFSMYSGGLKTLQNARTCFKRLEDTVREVRDA